MCCCCIPSNLLTFYGKTARLGFCSCNWDQMVLSLPTMGSRNRPIPVLSHPVAKKYFGNRIPRFCQGGFGIQVSHYANVDSSGSSGSNGFDIGTELGFKENKDQKLEFDKRIGDFEFGLSKNEADGNLNVNYGLEKESHRGDEAGYSEDEKLNDLEQQEPPPPKGRMALRKERQLVKRSSMLAKQVISVQSALGLGFVSQLWVDTSTWAVVVVEVRPNLLSSESERLLLEDIKQVGDVVLVLDESVLVNGLRMVGLETLVGYNVVTPGRQRIGKVRGFTFDIYSGSVESLELDSFGISIIPSSLVTTYALFTEDVLEVVSDTIIVHEATASRIQRLTKGLWAGQSLNSSKFDDRYSRQEDDEPKRPPRGGRGRGGSRRRKPYPGTGDLKDDWELPIDYL